MALTNDIERLRNIQSSEGKHVLSIYLNTDPKGRSQQNGEWKIRFKNGLKKIAEYLRASGNEQQLNQFQTLKSKVEKEIQDNQRSLQRSVVIFASEAHDLWSVYYLQMPVETSFYWESHPVIDQLEQFQKQYPQSGIILTHMDEVKVIETGLGEIQEMWSYTFDPETENWSFSPGLSASEREASSATHKDDFKKRFEENMQRWYRNMAVTIDQLYKKRNWERMYVAGEANMVRTMENHLKKDVDGRVEKNMSALKPAQILSEVFQKSGM
ncbi:VLRF1 family aeRF1-type release factor [Texcoconibacillus texcoconensis]|uniref:Antiporter n=1 Tax=Texcoconibacillus texcoconensis TaxID=1095777 RepID=A0A840QTQ5_9BACI|nr:VLRF1 family aeRF1-type release factor [Texcoconibacillus texcoconensis]MBB5174671.1 hypothetical protein [Texcoconibacillus texcoconensis]